MKNRQEIEERIKDIVTRCFSEVTYCPEYTIKGESDFFKDFKTDRIDYLVLLMKIKSSFIFHVGDRLIAGQTTVNGFCEKIIKAEKLSLFFDHKREPGGGKIVISEHRGLKHCKENDDLSFVRYAGKNLEKEGTVVVKPASFDASVVYLAIETNSPVAIAGQAVDVRAYYDNSFDEKTNLKNITEVLKQKIKSEVGYGKNIYCD